MPQGPKVQFRTYEQGARGLLNGRLTVGDLTYSDCRHILVRLQSGRCKGNARRLLFRRLNRFRRGWATVNILALLAGESA